MCRSVGTVPCILGLVWRRFRPKSGSKSQISGRILTSFPGPSSSAESGWQDRAINEGEHSLQDAKYCFRSPGRVPGPAFSAQLAGPPNRGQWGPYRPLKGSKGPRKLLRIRPEIFYVDQELGLKRSQTTPKIPGTVPTDRHTTIPNDSGPIPACFDDGPKLLNCEIAQPRGQAARGSTRSFLKLRGRIS